MLSAASPVRNIKTTLKSCVRSIEQSVRWINREPLITYDPLNAEKLKSLVVNPKPVILDVGCNDGSETAWFLETFPEARLFCFEPDARARKRFKEKIKDDRATLYDFAISDRDGQIEFHISEGWPSSEWQQKLPDGWDMSGSIRQPKSHLKRHPWCKFEKKIEVDTKRLDTWAEEAKIDTIDFLWVDVQGAEIDLIRGAQKTLQRTRYFYTEYSNRELYQGQVLFKELLALLPDFEVHVRYEKDVLLRNRKLAQHEGQSRAA